jgi:hypothetical protein
MGCLLKANGLYSRTTVGAVLLAAGAGARLGGRPKALLQLGSHPQGPHLPAKVPDEIRQRETGSFPPDI